jgi:mRNA-degrading endonuclease RelE of RelBE toxin-antitoxin system
MDRLAARNPRACAAIIEFVYGDLSANPARVGVQLRGGLKGSWRAARGAYRIVYSFDDETVHVQHVDHRADVYRPR